MPGFPVDGHIYIFKDIVTAAHGSLAVSLHVYTKGRHELACQCHSKPRLHYTKETHLVKLLNLEVQGNRGFNVQKQNVNN